MDDSRSTFSASVRLELLIADRVLRLAANGPRRVALREPVELDRCEAEVVMTIDGHEHRWCVRLPYGAVPFDHEVATERIEGQ